jgi:cyclohexanone monooxygenase
VRRVAEVASATFHSRADSWYNGANIPGKPRIFMPYVGGVGPYRDLGADVAAKGYEGFVFSRSRAASSRNRLGATAGC